MALILKISEEPKNIRVQAVAETTFSTVIVNGKKYFQLNMYGSANRQDVGKASQVVQFNENSARELVKLLKEYYNI